MKLQTHEFWEGSKLAKTISHRLDTWIHTPTAYLKAFTIKVSYNKREMKRYSNYSRNIFKPSLLMKYDIYDIPPL